MVSNKTIPTRERTRVQKLPKSPRRREPARWMPGAASPLLVEASDATVPALLRLLDAHESGLPASEIEPRLAKFGRNEVAAENPPAWCRMLLRNLRNPFVVVLMLLGAVSRTTGDLRAGIVVGVMVVVSVLMRFVSEYRSTLAAEALRTMVRTTATVIRQVVRAEPDGTMRLHPAPSGEGGGAGREHAPPVPPDAADPPVDPEPALRLLAAHDPVGPDGRGVPGATPTVGPERHRALHALHGAQCRPSSTSSRSSCCGSSSTRARPRSSPCFSRVGSSRAC